MSTAFRYTSSDLEELPDIEGLRYEIIDGVLHVSAPTRWKHQYVSGRILFALGDWNDETGVGVSVIAPGLIFAPDDEVAPDVVWIRRERLVGLLDEDGHLRGAPDITVEVLSAGAANQHRDREAKLDLYSRRGVQEY